MKELKVYWTPQGWMMIDPACYDLFGTDTLPTAYTARCTMERVRAELTRLNPDSKITFINPPHGVRYPE